MPEIWLRSNRRAIAAAMVIPAALLLIGLLPAVGLLGAAEIVWLRWLTGGIAALGAIGLVALLYLLRTPRLAYDDGRLLVNLRPVDTVAVPLEAVECFFLGSDTVGQAKEEDCDAPRTSTIVVRLAEKAKRWHRRDVTPALGRWSDGYIVLRGTWCEPIDMALVEGLNRRLANVKRQRDRKAVEA